MPNQATRLIEERREQILPTFSAEERERFKAFGTIVRFEKGARLNTTGEPVAGMFVLLAGHVIVRERHGAITNDLLRRRCTAGGSVPLGEARRHECRCAREPGR